MKKYLTAAILTATLFLLYQAATLQPTEGQVRPGFIEYMLSLVRSEISDSLDTITADVTSADLDSTASNIQANMLYKQEYPDSSKFDYGDGGNTTENKVDSLLAGYKIKLGSGDAYIYYNPTTDAIEFSLSSGGLAITQWPNGSAGYATGTIYDDTVYVANVVDWVDSCGVQQVCISNPDDRSETQVFDISSTNAAYLVLGSSWTGTAGIDDAEVTPYGVDYFRLLNTDKYMVFDRGDSAQVYDILGHRTQ